MLKSANLTINLHYIAFWDHITHTDTSELLKLLQWHKNELNNHNKQNK